MILETVPEFHSLPEKRLVRPRDESCCAVPGSEKGCMGVYVGFSAGGTLVWDFKAFVYVTVVGLASGVSAARGGSGSGGDKTENTESSGVREGGADADSFN